MRMIDRVHGNTTSLWPGVTLDSELVLCTRSLCEEMSVIASSNPDLPGKRTHQRFVGSATTSNDTNHASCSAADNLLCARWELDTGLAIIRVVADDGNIVAGCTTKGTTISSLLLHV